VWVVGAFVPVVLSISTSDGIDFMALGCCLAFFSYLGGIATAKHRDHFTTHMDPGGAENP